MESLLKTKEYFYNKQNRLSLLLKRKNKIPKPAWLLRDPADTLNGQFDDASILFKYGRLVMGFIVQANTLLFEKNNFNCPAAFVYSEDSFFDTHQDELGRIAHELYSFKFSDEVPLNLQAISNTIKNEFISEYNVLLPSDFTCGRNVFYTTILVCRKHLPFGRLVEDWLPLLILPERSKHAIVLPKYYWRDK